MAVKYHPNRFVDTFFDPNGRFQRMHSIVQKMVERTSEMTADDRKEFLHRIRDLAPSGASPDMPMDYAMDLAFRALEIYAIVEEFGEAGRQLFDFSRIAPMFVHTDVDDVDMSLVQLPYPSFYVHFGRGAELLVAPGDPEYAGVYLDGCYVRQDPISDMRNPGPIKLTLVCGYEGPDAKTSGDENRIGAMFANLTLQPTGAVSDSLVRRKPSGTESIVADAALLNNALRMVVNGLLYLNTQDPDIEETWGDDAPADLVARAARPNRGDAMRWAGKLAAMGYVRVKICGARVPVPSERAAEGEGGISPHWRRGHWRGQRYGEKLAFVRPKWIYPTIVNRKLGMPEMGHVYDVEPPGM